MSRRIEPIGTLDDLLAEKVAEFHKVDAEIAQFVSEHADTIRTLEGLKERRNTALLESIRVEKSIRGLGYVVSEKDSAEGLGFTPWSDVIRLNESEVTP